MALTFTLGHPNQPFGWCSEQPGSKPRAPSNSHMTHACTAGRSRVLLAFSFCPSLWHWLIRKIHGASQQPVLANMLASACTTSSSHEGSVIDVLSADCSIVCPGLADMIACRMRFGVWDLWNSDPTLHTSFELSQVWLSVVICLYSSACALVCSLSEARRTS